MNVIFRRGLALALCGCMSIGALTGCSKKTEKETEAALDQSAAAVTLGDDSISAGTANFILRYEQSRFESGLGMLYTYYGYTDYWNEDLYGNGQPFSETFKSQVQEQMQNMLQAKAHMADYGVEISAEDEKNIAAAADAFLAENPENVLGQMTATKENVEDALTLYTIQSRMEEAMSADVDTFVSDEEAAQRTVSYVYFTATTEAETEALSEGEEQLSEAAEKLTEAALEKETDVKTKSAAEPETLADESALEEEVPQEETELLSEAETEAETEDPAMVEARAKTLEKAEDFLESAKAAEDAAAFDELAAKAQEEGSNVYHSSFTFGADDTYPDAAIIEATEGLEDNTLVDRVIVVGTSYYVLYVADAFDEAATEEEKVRIVDSRKSDRIQELYTQWQGENEATAAADVFSLMLFDFSLSAQTEAPEAVTEAQEAVTEALTEALAEEAQTESGTETAVE